MCFSSMPLPVDDGGHDLSQLPTRKIAIEWADRQRSY